MLKGKADVSILYLFDNQIILINELLSVIKISRQANSSLLDLGYFLFISLELLSCGNIVSYMSNKDVI